MSDPPEPRPDDEPIDPNPSYSEPYSAPYSPPYPPYPGAYSQPAYPGQYFSAAPAPPPPGYPGAYPAPWDDGRPAGISAASVLAYVDAGFLILAGLLLLMGASAVDTWSNAFGSNDHSITAELATDGLINLIAAGLQIAGGVLIAGRAERGRGLLTAGGVLCVVAGLYWIIRVHDVAVTIWAIVFVVLPIVAVALIWTEPATDWLRGKDPRHRYPGHP